jgi:ferritin
VPGIGPAAVRKLAEGDEGADSVTNTYQLFGKYLMHKVEPVDHFEKFFQFLKNRGISSHRSAIVKAIAEKAATFFPNIYDANDYADSDDEE